MQVFSARAIRSSIVTAKTFLFMSGGSFSYRSLGVKGNVRPRFLLWIPASLQAFVDGGGLLGFTRATCAYLAMSCSYNL